MDRTGGQGAPGGTTPRGFGGPAPARSARLYLPVADGPLRFNRLAVRHGRRQRTSSRYLATAAIQFCRAVFDSLSLGSRRPVASPARGRPAAGLGGCLLLADQPELFPQRGPARAQLSRGPFLRRLPAGRLDLGVGARA